MAEVLLVTTTDIKKHSIIDGNLDINKFIQYVKIAQDIHIEQYTGTDLLEAIKTKIETNTLSGDYEALLDKYIKPMLIHWSLVEYYPYAAYTVSNNGVYKPTSENSETVEKEEIDFLIQKARHTAKHYTDRFKDYMCYNESKFPEWSSNTDEDIRPQQSNKFYGGWVL